MVLVDISDVLGRWPLHGGTHSSWSWFSSPPHNSASPFTSLPHIPPSPSTSPSHISPSRPRPRPSPLPILFPPLPPAFQIIPRPRSLPLPNSSLPSTSLPHIPSSPSTLSDIYHYVHLPFPYSSAPSTSPPHIPTSVSTQHFSIPSQTNVQKTTQSHLPNRILQYFHLPEHVSMY